MVTKAGAVQGSDPQRLVEQTNAIIMLTRAHMQALAATPCIIETAGRIGLRLTYPLLHLAMFEDHLNCFFRNLQALRTMMMTLKGM